MCKHVAATLYGIGARLDEDPLLFFTLRQADTEELVAQAVQGKTVDLLARAGRKSSRVIADADLSGLFGIDMEGLPDFSAATKPQAPRKPPRQKPARPAAAAKQAGGATQSRPATQWIEEIIRKKKPHGVTVAMLEETTGFPRAKIYAITSRLRQQGRIRYVAQGVYGPP
jgi:uncharacterized Zn finger protein